MKLIYVRYVQQARTKSLWNLHSHSGHKCSRHGNSRTRPVTRTTCRKRSAVLPSPSRALLTDHGTVAKEQLMKLRGEGSEEAAERGDEAAQNRRDSGAFSSAERYRHRWH